MKARENSGVGAARTCTNLRRDETTKALFAARPLRALSFATPGPYTGGVPRVSAVVNVACAR